MPEEEGRVREPERVPVEIRHEFGVLQRAGVIRVLPGEVPELDERGARAHEHGRREMRLGDRISNLEQFKSQSSVI